MPSESTTLPSGLTIPGYATTSAATTVNSQTCTLGSTCTIPFQTNSGGNTSQAGINLETSTTNAVGLTVTPTNSATNVEKFEITGGSYTGNAATATTASQVNGAVVPASAQALASNSSRQLIAATLAGAGSGLTTGPTSSTSNDAVTFTGTGGQIQDAGFAPAPAVACTTVSSLAPANGGCYNLSTSSSVAMPSASAFSIFTVNTASGQTATFTGDDADERCWMLQLSLRYDSRAHRQSVDGG